MSEELKPCPLCKSTDLKLYATHAMGHGGRRGVIKCPCGLELRVIAKRTLADLPDGLSIQEKYDILQREAKEAVVERWNRRAEQ